MVEFAFDIKHLFPQSIICVQPHLLRPKARESVLIYQNHKKTAPLTPACKLSQIIDEMGKRSAVAQGLRAPVTSAEKMITNTTNQVTYLMADDESGRWAVTGLLKVGNKDLFLFDGDGRCRQTKQTPAILDFYIHESRQRRGLGKVIFDKMLADQGWTPGKCSVDRPSKKLISFLAKHFGLVRTVPQGNNFVLYQEFFEDGPPVGQRNKDTHGSGGVGVGVIKSVATVPCRERLTNFQASCYNPIVGGSNRKLARNTTNSNANKNVSSNITNKIVNNPIIQPPNKINFDNDIKNTRSSFANNSMNSSKTETNNIASGSIPKAVSNQDRILRRNRMSEGPGASSATPQNQSVGRYVHKPRDSCMAQILGGAFGH